MLTLFVIKLSHFAGGSFAEFLHDDSSIELDCAENQQFSLWVSFAEIYNEFIYDLLSEPPAKGKQRPALKIAEDRNRNHFIKGTCSTVHSIYMYMSKPLSD